MQEVHNLNAQQFLHSFSVSCATFNILKIESVSKPVSICPIFNSSKLSLTLSQG